MKKHLFMIMAHNEPELLGRIVRKLAAPNHYFYIHIDKKKDMSPFLHCVGDVPNVDWCSELRMNVNWEGYSQIHCTLNLLRKAIDNKNTLDYFHLMSGCDYPIVGNHEFDAFFENAAQRSYMHFDSPQEVEDWRKEKYPSRLKWQFNDNRWMRTLRLPGILNRLFPRKPMENLYAGWTWWSWHRNVAEYVLGYLDEHPKFLNRFKFTSCCDEVIFHTMLYDVADKLKIEKYNSLRYIDWHPTRPYKSLPLVLNMEDAGKIINSGCLWCRKCTMEESGELLDYIDSNKI